jgi:hypothetical protein
MEFALSMSPAVSNSPRGIAPAIRGIATLFKRTDLGTPVHFLHIGKTGGTAIADALRPVAADYGILLHNHDKKLSDVPRHDRVFFFVRHPIARFVSGFNSRLRRGAPRYYYEWSEAEAKAFARFSKANDLAEALSATDEQTLARALQAMRAIQHVNSFYKNWFSSEQQLQERLESIVLLGLQEELSTDFEYLKLVLHLPQKIALPQDDFSAHRTPSGLDRNLSPLAERNLDRWYAEDIRFYERCLELRPQLGPRFVK